IVLDKGKLAIDKFEHKELADGIDYMRIDLTGNRKLVAHVTRMSLESEEYELQALNAGKTSADQKTLKDIVKDNKDVLSIINGDFTTNEGAYGSVVTNGLFVKGANTDDWKLVFGADFEGKPFIE